MFSILFKTGSLNSLKREISTRLFQPGECPSRGLLCGCEIFAKVRWELYYTPLPCPAKNMLATQKYATAAGSELPGKITRNVHHVLHKMYLLQVCLWTWSCKISSVCWYLSFVYYTNTRNHGIVSLGWVMAWQDGTCHLFQAASQEHKTYQHLYNNWNITMCITRITSGFQGILDSRSKTAS